MLSNARLRRSTVTRGSPRTPSMWSVFNSAIPPPGAVRESCIEFTAPVDVEVVEAANRALAA